MTASTLSSVEQALSMTCQTIMCPPSPAALERLYYDGMWEERRRKADEATAAYNLNALKEAATEALGHTCSGIYHLAQGGFNQVFILTFKDDLREPIIARLNGTAYHQDSDLESSVVSHRVASEIATLRFLKKSTSIPVAHVFAYATHPENPVKTRYSLQSQIIGRRLTDVWDGLTMEQMERVVQEVARIEGQILNVAVNSIGCLLTDDQTGPVRVGPMTLGRNYSPIGKDNNGPWSSSRDFLKALALSEISFMQNEPDSWLTRRKSFHPDEDANNALLYMSTWYTLLCKAIDSLNFEAFDPPSCPFVLRHDDLNLGNILVAWDDPVHVVGIVDWEGSRCIPLWAHMIGDHFLEPNKAHRSFAPEPCSEFLFPRCGTVVCKFCIRCATLN